MNKSLVYNAIGSVYIDFMPGFKLKMTCDWYEREKSK